VLHSGRLLTLPPNIRLGRKGLPGTNTLADLASSSVTEKKVFIKLKTEKRKCLEASPP
jgi:hypothetical protein